MKDATSTATTALLKMMTTTTKTTKNSQIIVTSTKQQQLDSIVDNPSRTECNRPQFAHFVDFCWWNKWQCLMEDDQWKHAGVDILRADWVNHKKLNAIRVIFCALNCNRKTTWRLKKVMKEKRMERNEKDQKTTWKWTKETIHVKHSEWVKFEKIRKEIQQRRKHPCQWSAKKIKIKRA